MVEDTAIAAVLAVEVSVEDLVDLEEVWAVDSEAAVQAEVGKLIY